MTRPVRVSARAVLVDENRVLLNHLHHDRAGDFYELPGGGIRAGETMEAAVRREVREETGYAVAVHELLWVRDYIAANHDFAYLSPPGFHALEVLFRCSLAGPPVVEAHEADTYQVGVEWVDEQRLGDIRLFPEIVVPALQAFLVDRTVSRPVYLGEES